MNINQTIFLDNQSTTRLDEEVFQQMKPYFTESYGNPHSINHSFGRDAQSAIENARKKIAEYLKTNHQDVYFTSGATEANNIFIKGLANFSKVKNKRIITSKADHKCVLQSCRRLEERGFDVVYLDIDKAGLINIEQLENALKKPTLLTSIMFVNNEIGTIQPIKQIGSLCRKYNSFFHTDAAQAVGKLNIDVNDLNIDALSISGHKTYGPKGIGVLYVNAETRLKMTPLFDGGGQEKELRSGTLPTPLCVGIGEAIKKSATEMKTTNSIIKSLRNKMFELLINGIPDLIVNGDIDNRIEGNLNLLIPGIDANALINNVPNLAISTGSACTSGYIERSHVLKSLGLTDEEASYSFRIGIGKYNTEEEIEIASQAIITAANKIRKN